MSAHRKALRIVTFPFRAMWFLVLVANFLVVMTVCVVITAFLAYGLAMTLSYILLPTEWTRALWQWGANLYAHSHWFKGATITFFVLLLLPVLKLWPGRDLKADTAREREAARINDDLIAARQRTQAQAKLRG
ncbi:MULTISPECIES: hypothetical protein [Rhizobium]|uniref:hypothetical protein n=1 Tax=Rhizobium TaxID=379 RepID=UPI001C82F436|nr:MULTISPECIES: hypothetical protein [Rhizobium]MBX4893762.1 hypothetical protein [Rhizobium bangladeshense]MBX5014412.1 hypothetical protein [Rhizobium lentis]